MKTVVMQGMRLRLYKTDSHGCAIFVQALISRPVADRELSLADNHGFEREPCILVTAGSIPVKDAVDSRGRWRVMA